MAFQIVVAQWDFSPEQPDELDVSAGQRLKVLEQAEEWYYAEVLDPTQHNTITKGYIPSSYCEPEEYEEYEEEEEEELPPPSVAIAEAQVLAATAGSEIRETPGGNVRSGLDIPKGDVVEVDESFQIDASSYSPKPSETEIDESFQVDVSPKSSQGRVPPPPPPVSPSQNLPASTTTGLSTPDVQKEGDESVAALKLNSPKDPVPSEDDLRKRFEELKLQAEAIRLVDPTDLNLKSESPVQPPPPPPPPPPKQQQQQHKKKPLPVAPPPPPPPSVATAHKKLLEKRLQEKELEEFRKLELRKAALKQEVQLLEQKKQAQSRSNTADAERQKLAEESRRRAAFERKKREVLEAAQRAELEREYEELKAVGVKDTYVATFAHKDTSASKSKANAATLNDAVKLVKEAVNADNQKRFTQAYGLYSKAIDAFIAAINARKVSSKTLPTVIERMQGYVMRLYTLENTVCKSGVERKSDMVEVLTVMTKCGFNPVPKGEELYLEGRLSETTGKVGAALCAYTQGLEYMMAFHHACKARYQRTSPDVLDKIGKMLDKAEKLKRSTNR